MRTRIFMKLCFCLFDFKIIYKISTVLGHLTIFETQKSVFFITYKIYTKSYKMQ